MKYEFTGKELGHIEDMKKDLIIELYCTKDNERHFAIERALKKVYLMGREMNTEIDLFKIA